MRKIAAVTIAALALVLSMAPIAGAVSSAPAALPPTCDATQWPPTPFPCIPPPEDINCYPYIDTYGVEALAARNEALQARADWTHAFERAQRLRKLVEEQRHEIRRLRAEVREIA